VGTPPDGEVPSPLTKKFPENDTCKALKEVHQPFDDRRKALALQVLRETGSIAAAERACSPHCRSDRPGHSTFQRATKSDPAFALAVEAAKRDALAKIEAFIAKLACGELQEPIYRKDGSLVGFKTVIDSRVILAHAQKLSKDWVPARQVEHTGEIGHRITGAMFVVRPEDVLLLDEPDQQVLVEILKKLSSIKKETGNE